MFYQVNKKPFVFIIFNCFFCFSHAHATENIGDDKFVLDESLFKNQSGETVKLLQKISNDEYSPGVYNVDIYVNGKYISRQEIDFVLVSGKVVKPCLYLDTLKKIGIADSVLKKIEEQKAACSFLTDFVDGQVDFNLSSLRLNLTIANDDLVNLPRGFVNPNLWDAGNSMLFLNYTGNAYHSVIDNDFGDQKRTSGFLSLSGGINFNKWQFRQQSHLNYSDEDGSSWANERSYLQRPIEQIKGNLLLGQTYTSGRFFSGLRFNGLNISSDDRMLPQSMRGYAPTIQGIAVTNAKVSIFQNKRQIYETTVAPGSFTINDLYPTSYSGDLLVKVEEADGSKSEFTVPFSAVPESLRKGAFKYNLDSGKTDDVGDDSYFTDLNFQYGVSNKSTLITGVRVADDYYAGLFGATYSDFFGTVGSTVTYSYANDLEGETLTGWMANLNYSKTFSPTQTTLSLAGYRYSTTNYRDLNDILEYRYTQKHNDVGDFSEQYKQRSRFDLTMNQTLGSYGTLFLSGSMSDYHDTTEKNIQAQLGYNKSFNNGVNLNVSLVKQYFDKNKDLDFNHQNEIHTADPDRKTETSVSLSLSIPLEVNNKGGSNNIALSYSNDGEDINSYQATFSGFTDTKNPLNYSVGLSYDDQSDKSVVNANLGKRFTYFNTGVSASASEQYWQVAGNMQGSLAIHSGGVTFGQYLGDTFALVEAQGAQGAEVNNSQGTKIDRNGYALIPALTPYQYNTVSLNPVGTSYNLEIQSTQDQVVPYAGAAIKVKFDTKIGYPLLIQARTSEDKVVPLGASITNEKGEVLGVVGQSGQMYIRSDQPKGKLIVGWGNSSNEQCAVDYEIPNELDEDQPLIRLTGTCVEMK